MNQPELTQRAFIEWWPPEAKGQGHPRSVRLYKTGDLVRWNDNGELEFFGRIDSQVKLRGYRIEFSEIEAVLLEHPHISGAVATVYEADGMQSLAAYVRLVDGVTSLNRSQLLATLRNRLPAYMVPAYLDVVSEFPLLTSGKVDRPQKPLIAEDDAINENMTELEADIAGVWAKVVRASRVGLDQDFFTDLGGHSLLAAQLVTALREDLGLSVPVRDIYAYPTVRRLAARIAERTENESKNLPTNVPVSGTVHAKRPWWTTLLQIIYLLAIVPMLSLPLVYILPLSIDVLHKRASVVELAVLVLAVSLATWMGLIQIAIAAKWLFIGRYRPGRYPLWGATYIRW